MILIQSPNASEMANDERSGLQNARAPQEYRILTPLVWGKGINSAMSALWHFDHRSQQGCLAFRWRAVVHANEAILYALYMSATGAAPLPHAGWRTTSILSRD